MDECPQQMLYYSTNMAFFNHFFRSTIVDIDRLKKRGAFDSAKNHKRQRRKRQPVTAKREKSNANVRIG